METYENIQLRPGRELFSANKRVQRQTYDELVRGAERVDRNKEVLEIWHQWIAVCKFFRLDEQEWKKEGFPEKDAEQLNNLASEIIRIGGIVKKAAVHGYIAADKDEFIENIQANIDSIQDTVDYWANRSRQNPEVTKFLSDILNA